MDEFFTKRLALYKERKAYQIRLLKKEVETLQNKQRFIR